MQELVAFMLFSEDSWVFGVGVCVTKLLKNRELLILIEFEFVLQ